ncbi:MAG: SdiA-regulated domain-containing protein, partial [Candidatus Aminicenantes bacterium]
ADIDKQGIAEPSGVCFHPLRKTLFVVSDDGGLFEIETDGTPVSSVVIPPGGLDLEDVTVHPQTGLLYLVVEGDDIILEYDPDKKELRRSFPMNREYQGNPNFLVKQEKGYDDGIESITFVPDENHPEGGTFYTGNQLDPPCIMEVLVPLKTSQATTAEARILRVLPFVMKDPSGLYYDPKTGLLNVISDVDNIFVELTLTGKMVKEYAFPGNNQEGIAWDEDGFLYIAQDIGGIIRVKDLRKKD